MSQSIILASSSMARRALFDAAGVDHAQVKPAIDEQSIKAALQVEGLAPDEVADHLAEAKARKVSNKHPDSIVIGSDQILAFEGHLMSKPQSPDDALAQLMALCGKTHILYSAAVIYKHGKPQWRVVKPCRMTMRDFSEGYASEYVDRNWDEIRHCVGCYQIEAEGARLFAQINGDQFSIMGFPLIDTLNHLALTGAIET